MAEPLTLDELIRKLAAARELIGGDATCVLEYSRDNWNDRKVRVVFANRGCGGSVGNVYLKSEED